jgi:hypothetical protein
MNKTIISAMSALILAACTTNDEQCQKWGAEPGTPTYVNCMATLAQKDAADNAAAQASLAAMQAQQAANQARLQQFLNAPVR